ncbi:MAG TPA: DUF4190 domain-containing protein [Thermoanaerobaculia bacterium]|nr:DUF4190 domain-containing protein [Thermoanaerobaculia bacterium]
MTIPDAGPSPQPSPSSQAITALVVGILGFVMCCFVLSPIAWYLGSQEVRAIREGRSPASGEVLAKVAVILGIVGTLALVAGLVWLALGGLAILSAVLQNWQ